MLKDSAGEKMQGTKMPRGLFRIIWYDGYQEKHIETPYAEGAYCEAKEIKRGYLNAGLKESAESVSVWKKVTLR